MILYNIHDSDKTDQSDTSDRLDTVENFDEMTQSKEPQDCDCIDLCCVFYLLHSNSK